MTHAGRRGQNQDTIVTETIDTAAGPVRVAAVLDGMGGMKAGDRASQLAADIFLRDLRQSLGGTHAENEALRAALTQAVHRAHHAVHAEGRADPAKHGMGTTLVAVLERRGRFVVANVGDSRAYLWDPQGEGFRVLTRDHSLREEAVRVGAMTREEAEASPIGHALTRSIGSSTQPDIDLFPEPAGWYELPRGGALLLCSDGLPDGLDDIQMRDYLAGSPDAKTAALNLVRAAYHGGSRDNISVVLMADAAYQPVTAVKPTPPPIDQQEPRPKTPAEPKQVPTPKAPSLRKIPGAVPGWLVLAAIVMLVLIFTAIYFAAQPSPAPPLVPAATPTESAAPPPATPPTTSAPAVPGPEVNPFAPNPPPNAPPAGTQSP